MIESIRYRTRDEAYEDEAFNGELIAIRHVISKRQSLEGVTKRKCFELLRIRPSFLHSSDMRFAQLITRILSSIASYLRMFLQRSALQLARRAALAAPIAPRVAFTTTAQRLASKRPSIPPSPRRSIPLTYERR